MLNAQRVSLKKNLLLYDPAEQFILQEGKPYTIPPELPFEDEEDEEFDEESAEKETGRIIDQKQQSMQQQAKSIIESPMTQPPSPRYSYLQKIPNPLRSKATSILSYLHFHVDPLLLKCLETGQVRVQNVILPGAELSQILPSLVNKSSVESGEAYLLQYLRKSPEMKRLLHPSKAGTTAKQSFIEEQPHVDPPVEQASFRAPPAPPKPKQVTSSYYDGLVSRPFSTKQMRPTSTVYVQPKVKLKKQMPVQKFKPQTQTKTNVQNRRQKPWFALNE